MREVGFREGGDLFLKFVAEGLGFRILISGFRV